MVVDVGVRLLIVRKTEKWNRNAMKITPKTRSDERERKKYLLLVVIVDGETSNSIDFKAVG